MEEEDKSWVALAEVAYLAAILEASEAKTFQVAIPEALEEAVVLVVSREALEEKAYLAVLASLEDGEHSQWEHEVQYHVEDLKRHRQLVEGQPFRAQFEVWP